MSAPPHARWLAKLRQHPLATLVAFCLVTFVVGAGAGAFVSTISHASGGGIIDPLPAGHHPLTTVTTLAVGVSNATVTRAPTRAPITLLKTAGNGGKKTPTFTAPGPWDLIYHCRNTTPYASRLLITIYTNANTYSDYASYTCAQTYGGDITVEHKGGSYYLQIDAVVPWDITVTTH